MCKEQSKTYIDDKQKRKGKKKQMTRELSQSFELKPFYLELYKSTL